MCESSFDLQFSLYDKSDDENAVNVKDKVSTERYLPPVNRVCILRVSSPYFLYLYVQKYKSLASVGSPVAVGPCALHTLHTLLLRH